MNQPETNIEVNVSVDIRGYPQGQLDIELSCVKNVANTPNDGHTASASYGLGNNDKI